MWLKTLDIGKQREEILKLFDEFRDQILKDYSADKVILNESYLNSKCQKALADGTMPTAILKAPEYVWNKI